MMSVMQVQDDLRKGETTYLTAPIETKPNQKIEVPELVVDILEKFTDVMPLVLLKNLPTRPALHQK